MALKTRTFDAPHPHSSSRSMAARLAHRPAASVVQAARHGAQGPLDQARQPLLPAAASQHEQCGEVPILCGDLGGRAPGLLVTDKEGASAFQSDRFSAIKGG